MSGLGRALMALGLLLMVVGAAVWAVGRLRWRLPGDFVWHRGPVTVYFPLASMLLLSLLLTLLLNLVWRR
jgi:hypothetical protein